MKVLVAMLLVCLSVLGMIAPADQARATPTQQDDPTPVEITEDVDQPVGGIIPKPNSGAAPDDPGDRGGALQLTLLGLILVFGGVAFFSVRNSSRKALAQRAAADR